ncbi:hypothetical protein GWI33_016288 [Rhynchophorus ferrugineus]|uniref:Phenoloxidase-activating factor 2 n=1 Tax=Rhynchophorus ferrugineus TaxID=354439 RepID=A0A834I142_RHYFE|nr:hypothetical protein GWI33_016288 [Rhynchophorus ferrugineus]
MRLLFAPGALLLLLSCTVSGQQQWSWNQDSTKAQALNTDESFDLKPAASENVQQSVQLNVTDTDKVIDDILVSTRQGRALQGYDEIYSDPNVQEVLQKGDEGEARNIIKDRLCYLGLVQCDEEIEGKRPYIAPEELIYAQPVAINPVGRPIPTIPVKGVRGGYGPAKPINIPPGNKFGPPPVKYPPFPGGPPKPPRRGYGPVNSGFNSIGGIKPPQFGGPIGKPPFLSDGEILAEGEFLNKPPSLDYFNKPPSGLSVSGSPYQFESVSHSSAQKDKRVEITVNAQGGLASAGNAANKGLVEHVHHHYHHNADGVSKTPTVVVNPVPIAAAAVTTSLNSLNQANSFSSSSSLNSNGFIPAGTGSLPLSGSSSSFGGLNTASYGGQTLANYGGLSSSSSGFGGIKPITENYGAQTFGGSSSSGLGSFGSSSYFDNGLYKKELNVNSGSSNYLQSNYADKYLGVESGRAENYDCVCVPYDQCPTHEVIGRKDDLFLALDPRNLKSDIEAIADNEETRVITDGNGTMTVIRVPKDVNNNATEKAVEVKKVSKREAPQASADNSDDKDHKIEGRQYPSQYEQFMKKIKPTFGVSFGLPYQGGGGYPFSPHGIYPHHGTVDATGVNLGLISVNPLVSIQVTKDDYGNKVIKPFVNLHVTPNSYLVNKFEDLISYKKGVIFNKHKHYHVHHPYVPHDHFGYEGPYREHPEDFHPGPPEFHHGPPHIHHGPPHIHHGPPHVHHGPSDFHPSYHGPEIFDNPPDIYKSPYPEPEFEGPSGPGPDFYPEKYGSYYDNPLNYGGGYHDDSFVGRSSNNISYSPGSNLLELYRQKYANGDTFYGNKVTFDASESNSVDTTHFDDDRRYGTRGGKSLNLGEQSNTFKFPTSRKRRDLTDKDENNDSSEGRSKNEKRQAYYGRPQTCGPRHVCCRRSYRPAQTAQRNQCGTRHSQGINGRIKNPVYVDGDSEFGEYPWQVAILKRDPKESVYVCGGTLIDPLHIITAAHCVKQYTNFDLRVRLGEWDVNHDVEFYPYIERDVAALTVHPEFYAGTLYNDIAILRMSSPVDWSKHPHISPACLPHPQDDYTGSRCWTTGWGKDAFGDFGKYQNILKEVDVPIVNFGQCQRQLQNTRLGYDFKLHPGFVCAGGEEGKDACKGDGGGPMVCERGGTWQVVGVVSWGIGCGQAGVPGVYVRVAHYLDWIKQVTQRY